MREGLAGGYGVECPVLYERGGEPAVVFLHGYSFRGRTWAELGYTSYVEELGYSYAAPDMPYGRRTGCTTRAFDVDVNMAVIREALRLSGATGPALFIGASLGSRYAIYASAAGLAGGLLLAAPALGGDEGAWSLLRGLRLRWSVVVWGDRDSVVGRGEVEEVARRLRARLIIARGAGHVSYRDDPRLFRDLIREALEALAPATTL